MYAALVSTCLNPIRWLMFDRMLPAAATKARRDALTGKRAPTDTQEWPGPSMLPSKLGTNRIN
jgi:hypothetical protein